MTRSHLPLRAVTMLAFILPLSFANAQDAPPAPPRPEPPAQRVRDPRPTLQDHEIRIVEVRHADAEEIAITIDRLIKNTSSYACLNVFRPRNAIIVASNEPSVVERIAALIGELDVAPEPSEADRVEVDSVSLLHANACELTEVLCRLAPNRADLRIVPDARTNNLWFSGDVALVRTFTEIARTMDKQTRDTGSARRTSEGPTVDYPVKVYGLAHVDADEVAAAIQRVLGPGRSSTRVVPEAGSNRLLVRADPGDLRQIESLIATLDLPTKKGEN